MSAEAVAVIADGLLVADCLFDVVVGGEVVRCEHACSGGGLQELHSGQQTLHDRNVP